MRRLELVQRSRMALLFDTDGRQHLVRDWIACGAVIAIVDLALLRVLHARDDHRDRRELGLQSLQWRQPRAFGRRDAHAELPQSLLDALAMTPLGFCDLPDDVRAMRVANALGEDLVLRTRLHLPTPRVEQAPRRGVFSHATSCATASTIWAAE